jgi:hypothetical protein
MLVGLQGIFLVFNMSKLNLSNFATLQNSSIISSLNTNNVLIENAVENTLSRDGTSPNVMSSNLDMNSNQILNLPAPSTLDSPLRLIDYTTANLISSAAGSITFNTLAEFQALTAIPSFVNYVTVNAVTGSYPAATGLEATLLTYRRVSSTTGLYGEITVAGQLFAPVYSTNPVNIGEFGAIGDAVHTEGFTVGIVATSDGTSTLTVNTTALVVVGMNVTNVNWHSFSAAAIGSAGVIPTGTTVVSFVPGVSITLSNPVVAASNLSVFCWSDTLTGTDNTAAIQAALDFAMQNGYSNIKFPNGKFLISDTLNLGWGNSFYELHLKGNDRGSYGGSLPGTTLYSTKIDRPLINISGARVDSIRGITFIGRNRVFAQFTQQFLSFFSSDPLDWIDPTLVPSGNNPGGLQSTAPYAAITIDAYAAAQPTKHYPTRTFPSWTGLSLNYSVNYSLSSDIIIEDCDFEGFGVGIVSGLVTNNQGDFIKMNRLVMTSGPYGVSINNTQSRNVQFENINYAGFHTLFSSTNLGQGTGEIVGPITNLGGGSSYQTFDFGNLAFTGPLIIKYLYFENQVRLGNFIASSSFSAPVLFEGGLWQFQAATVNTIPKSYITSGQFGYISLYGVEISGNYRISNLIDGGGDIKIEGGAFSCALSTNTSSPLIQAVNYTGGCLFGDVRFNTVLRDSLQVKNLISTVFNSIGGGLACQVLDDEVHFQNSGLGVVARAPMTQCAKNYNDTFGRRWQMTVTTEVATGVGTFSSGPTYSNDQMSFGWPSANQTSSNVMQNLAVGDILFHVNTGTIFVITVVGALSGGNYPITTVQQNNLQVNSTNVFVANINPDPTLAAGNIIIIKTGAIIPSVLEYATFSSGSPSVTAISDGSGTSHMLNNYANGDYFFGLPTTISSTVPYRQWPITPGSVLSAVTDGTPGTLTLSKNALVSGVFPLFPYELY